MISQDFPFGAKLNWDMFTTHIDDWKYYFNFGFSTNEFKWDRVEKVKGTKDYSKADQVVDAFNAWGIPLNGNTAFWEVFDPNPGDTKVLNRFCFNTVCLRCHKSY